MTIALAPAVPLSLQDGELLGRAVELAARGATRVRPNPQVGAVVARDGRVVGEGWHQVAGGPHAEVNAFAACAGENLDSATLYVSLEPCAHEGRTPPCVDAVLRSNVGRVVIGSLDPNDPDGRGRARLQQAGVEVVVASAAAAERARQLNQPFFKHARTGRPWVRAKLAMTLDGKVAARSGDSKWISSDDSRQLAHGWRADADAVIAGIGTVLADDPLLTARGSAGADGAARQPRRVVFDQHGRLPSDSRLLRSLDAGPVTVVVGAGADRARLERLGADVLTVTAAAPADRVREALDGLGKRAITSALLEGGPRLAGAFLDAGEIDELQAFVAPKVLGDAGARSAFDGRQVARIAEARATGTLAARAVGADVLITSTLERW